MKRLYNFLYIFAETFLILRRMRLDIIISVYRYSGRVPVILVGFR